SNIRLFSANLNGLLEKYDILFAKKESGNSEASLKVFMRIEGGDPLVLIDLKESILERDVDMATIKAEIYSNYIELLDVSGKLSEQPLKNYISAGLEPLMP
ncbi:MAG: hypothetical protein QGG48_12060, partial [Desulfatiglandales bacterium]|nr:hypothetical protein [Desulfatiglandales bacterium]